MSEMENICDLVLLPFKVMVVTVNRNDIKQVSFLFMQHIFRKQKLSYPFFHLTATDFECSLFIDVIFFFLLF